MTTASAIPSLSSLQLPEKREQPACYTPISRWQWLDRLDSNNRRILAPHVAIGVKAFADLAKESHLGSSGAWQAVTTFFYSVNILLIPTAVENLVSSVTRLKNKQNWSSILALRNIRTIFQSSLSVIVPMTFASIGLKDACQLLGHTIKPFERVLNFVVPWVKGIGRLTALLQVYDLINGFVFSNELNRCLIAYDELNVVVSCSKIVCIIEKYKHYLQNCRSYNLSYLNLVTGIQVKLKCHLNNQYTNMKISHLFDETVRCVNELLELSNHHMHYQAQGLFLNCVSLATMTMTNSIGIAILLLGVSLGHISREVV